MHNELKRPKAKPLPTLLTKSDAMLFAADQLEQHISNLELAAIFADAFSKKPLEADDEKGREALDEIRTLTSGIVDKDIQVAAMRDAAKEIRAMANEAKLADARAARQGIAVSA
ncbi:hypothetical protein [Sphingopyxis sp. NJF-3]